MKLGVEVDLSPGHIVSDGTQLPLPKRGTAPQFTAHVCCGQTAGWIKMPLGTEVDLGPTHIVLDGDLQKGGGDNTPNLGPYIVAKRLHGSRCHLVQQTAGWVKMPLGTELASAQVTLC